MSKNFPPNFYTFIEAIDVIGRYLFGDDWTEYPKDDNKEIHDDSMERYENADINVPSKKRDRVLSELEEAIHHGHVTAWVFDPRITRRYEIQPDEWGKPERIESDFTYTLGGLGSWKNRKSGCIRIDKKTLNLKLGLETRKERSYRSERAAVTFPLPDGIKWKDVVIRVEPETLLVSAGGKQKRYPYAEIGFGDSRKSEVPPTLAWEMLKFIGKRGRLSWHESNEHLSEKKKNYAKKRIGEIRVNLKKLMGLEDDPFERYTPSKGWKPKFRVVSSDESFEPSTRMTSTKQRRVISPEHLSDEVEEHREENGVWRPDGDGPDE